MPSRRVAIVQGRVVLPDGSHAAITPPQSRASRRWVPVEVLAPGTMRLAKQLWVAAGQPTVAHCTSDRNAQPVRPAGVERGPLILLDPAGQPVHPDVISDSFARISRAAGLPSIRLHDTRHALATDLASDPQVPDIAGAAVLGHDVATFHAFYAQRSDDAMTRAAQQVGNRIAEALCAAE